jgi:hypothetical protein
LSKTIHIPFELARYATWQRKLVTHYETNAVIKALDTWLVLKAESTPSLIQDWNQQKHYLFSLCKCSESIFRHRLKVLQELNLLTFDRHNIWLCSWQQLGEILEIDINAKFTIQYNINDKQRVQDWIIATEIKDNQSRQAYKIMQNLGKNPALKQAVISAILQAGGDRSQINNVTYFLSWFKILYYNDFVRASAIHNVMIDIRPDTNRGVKGMAAAWNCKHQTTVSYWKHVLQKSGIIDIGKIQIQSMERVRNSECKVLWIDKQKQTLLCICDQITLLTPWTDLKDNTYNTDQGNRKLSAA